MSDEMSACFLGVSIFLGFLGAGLGAWVFSRAMRAQLQAQRSAFEQAREQAQRDLQQALLCVPQWVQQTVRLELQLRDHQQAERDRARMCEQRRWQGAQDAQRQAEWRALLKGFGKPGPSQASPSPGATPSGGSAPAPVSSPVATFLPEFSTAVRKPPAAPVPGDEAPARELTDEEIDALPPDLPPAVRPQGRKISARNKTILRNI